MGVSVAHTHTHAEMYGVVSGWLCGGGRLALD